MTIILDKAKVIAILDNSTFSREPQKDPQKPEVGAWRTGKSLKLSYRGLEGNKVIAFVAFLFKDGL